MSYSRVSGKYFYGNGDFYYIDGFITNLWGGGNYYAGQKILWNYSPIDGFEYLDSFNNTDNLGYYILDEVINYPGTIDSSSHRNLNGLKVLSYYDSNAQIVLIPNPKITYGLGNESGYIEGYSQKAIHFSNYTSFDLDKNYFQGDSWGNELGAIDKNQIISIDDSVNSQGYKYHKFDCYKRSYINFKLKDFIQDLDLVLLRYNNEIEEWENIFNSQSNSDILESFFKILDPGSYIIAITNYENKNNQSYKLEVDTKTFHENTVIPNDSLFEEQWSLLNHGQGDGFDNADVYAPGAWKLRNQSPNVVVAVIDSGIDYNHEDLKKNIWKNKLEIANNGIDDDSNGYIDDNQGWDFYNNDKNPHPHSSSNIHGTHVAGIIGAEGNNGKGVAGVTWDVQLMNLKVFSDYKEIKTAYVSDIWDAIIYAADNGADIINLSLGIDIGRQIVEGGYYYKGSFNDFKKIAPAFYNGWYSVLKYASDKGCSIIAAAGNEFSSNDDFTCIPADFASEIPGMISVAAASNKGRIASYSNYGNIISIAAPGGDFNSGKESQILSTIPNNRYEAVSGSSSAAPLVSGGIALILAENPSLSPEEIKQILMNSGDKYKWLEGRVNSNNFLNLQKAISFSPGFDTNKAPTSWYISTTNFDENISPGSTVAILYAVDENQSDTHTYSLVDGYEEKYDNKFFTIKGDKLKINSSPNYEAKNSYKIVIKATDQFGLSTNDLYVVLTVNDVLEYNEAPTDISLSSSYFDENIPSNTTIAKLNTVDQDINDDFVYSLISGEGDKDNNYFKIIDDSLKIKNSPNYEIKSSYTIRIKTEDIGGNTYTKRVSLSVNDLNEEPTDFYLSSYTLEENIPPGTTIATIHGVDEDIGDTHTFSFLSGFLQSSGNSSFIIDGNKLIIKDQPDYEKQSSYTVVIQAIDQNGKSSKGTYYKTINVIDIKENKETKIANQTNRLVINNKYKLDKVKDYDGNPHGFIGSVPLKVNNSYKYQGTLDVNNDGNKEAIYTNHESGRWVTASIDPVTGDFDFSNYGEGGSTRIVGIYEDPLVANGTVQKDSDFDSSKTFFNDLKLDNLILKTVGDFDGDGFQELYWSKVDNTAYLRAVMHADGNIQYANYQNLDQMTNYLTSNGFADTVALII
ncbi:S8 family serine peptidase [Prochlorococcus marinus]|uniref:S8 family serine peptidase n=1 Tax=Prochlorococcus marinus TaxID=1219 RepID=UPI0022B2EFF0|nr:S8 family serine peptidase [Prochlorococcus marinus]